MVFRCSLSLCSQLSAELLFCQALRKEEHIHHHFCGLGTKAIVGKKAKKSSKNWDYR